MDGRILTPTDDYPSEAQPRGCGFHHLMPHLRIGRISGEEFAREKVLRIQRDPDYDSPAFDPEAVVAEQEAREQEQTVVKESKSRKRKKG